MLPILDWTAIGALEPHRPDILRLRDVGLISDREWKDRVVRDRSDFSKTDACLPSGNVSIPYIEVERIKF